MLIMIHSNGISQRETGLAQSASALGAGILGFGIGAKWGGIVANYSLLIIIVGAIIHVTGMYIMQIRNRSKEASNIAKVLWFSAWICLIVLVFVIIYLMVGKN